jgi:hypothetical protein
VNSSEKQKIDEKRRNGLIAERREDSAGSQTNQQGDSARQDVPGVDSQNTLAQVLGSRAGLQKALRHQVTAEQEEALNRQVGY